MLLFLLIALAAAYVFYTYWQYAKFPPGPLPIPLLGHLLHLAMSIALGKTAAGTLMSWKQRYGNVFTVWVGPFPLVCVGDYKLAVEEFIKKGDVHSGRYPGYLLEQLRDGNHGIVFAEGPLWQEQRRFAMHVLRNFGMGRNLMEEKILEEVNSRIADIKDDLSKSGGQLVLDPKPVLDLMVGSIISSMLFGIRFEQVCFEVVGRLPECQGNKNEFFLVKHLIDEQIEMLAISDVVCYNAFTRHLPYLKQRADHLSANTHAIYRYLEKNINDHKQHFEFDREPEDFTYAYFHELEKRRRAGEAMGHFSEKQLKFMLFDLWFAGMETTISTLQWAFLYMIRYPEIQDRCREEIVATLDGENRDVLLNDRTKLPFTNATITEIQRCASILNFNLVHKTTADTVIDGYSIPKGTMTVPQISVIMGDENNFENATRFDPSRYLDAKTGKEIEQYVIPFGIGKRICPGEGLARAELFLVFTNLLKQFRFSVPPGLTARPSLSPLNEGFFRPSKPYQCQITTTN